MGDYIRTKASFGVNPSAPEIDSYNGYESVTFDATVADPPPPYEEGFQRSVQSNPRQIHFSANISEEEVRSALKDFVSENCCFGSKPVKQMVFTGVVMNYAFHYNLKTFTERRETKWVFEPYKGQPISYCITGQSPPTPWQVQVMPEVFFKKSQKTVEIPQTANVRNCHICGGVGRQRCVGCLGFGGQNCIACNGRGQQRTGHSNQNQRCGSCDGNGRTRCGQCTGHGQVQCLTCEGFSQLKFYIQLTVNWDVHCDDYIKFQGKVIPENLLINVSGNDILDEKSERVSPIADFPDQQMCEKSRFLIQKHLQSFPTEHILHQSQSIRVIPIALVTYSLNEKVGSFQVYGLENEVYFPDYPSKCCCGCSIM